MHENEISGIILDTALKIHTRLGPGLLESVYGTVLAYELEKRELVVRRQMPIPLIYDDICIGEAFRADLVVEGKVIVELKSIEEIAPVHKMQVLTYLRLCGLHLGLLINFNVVLLKDGFHRIVNNLRESPLS
jgi:GxxExxY protein